MGRPDFITFTGADDRTAVPEMAALAADYPVEFGILFSGARQGSPRYPGTAWADAVQDSGLRLAAHVCGSYAHEIVTEGRCSIDARLRGFARIQVNTAAAVAPSAVRRWTDSLAALHGRPVEPILQCRGAFPADDQVNWLYDCSGGRGVRPDAWPVRTPATRLAVGYAGGLGPDNVAEILEQLPDLTGCWIDMETRVRDADDRFDIGLCRRVCEAVYG